jgi:hypothetical protein
MVKNSSYNRYYLQDISPSIYPQENALKPTLELQLYGNQTLE